MSSILPPLWNFYTVYLFLYFGLFEGHKPLHYWRSCPALNQFLSPWEQYHPHWECLIYVKVFVNCQVLFRCKALLLIICISYDIICLFCSCLFLIADFPVVIRDIYYFVVHFAAFGTIFLQLTSDELSAHLCLSEFYFLQSLQ